MIPLRDNISSKKFPIVNYLVILANTIVFLFELSLVSRRLLEPFIFEYGVISVRILHEFHTSYRTIFSSMFIHGSWMHFLGNMLYLYIFGDNVEDRLGHFNYMLFYVFCGIFAALVQVFLSIKSTVPMVGASGAIAGVLGAYFILYPRARILTLVPLGIFIRIFEIPAFFYLGFWFLLQTWSGTLSLATMQYSNVGGIAFWAHSGGFIAGIGWIILFLLKKKFL